MHVFGTRENEKAGSILFTGAMEECKKYVHEHLNDSNWY